jgi:hypothetical protein
MQSTRLILALGFSAFACAAETASSEETAFLDVLKASFTAWDLNHDGSLAKLEIDTALADPKIQGDAAAALAVVKRLNRSKSWSSIPLTLEGLSVAAKTTGSPNLAVMFTEGRKSIANTKRTLFTEAAPSLLKLRQGDMGNCFSLAPLGCMLSRDPMQVKAWQEGHPHRSAHRR